MSNRRVIVLGLLGLSATTLPGCMTKPLQPVRADGTYCYAYGRAYRQLLTCTTDPIPPSTVEAEAKQIQADPSALTVYVIDQFAYEDMRVLDVVLMGHEEMWAA